MVPRRSRERIREKKMVWKQQQQQQQKHTTHNNSNNNSSTTTTITATTINTFVPGATISSNSNKNESIFRRHPHSSISSLGTARLAWTGHSPVSICVKRGQRVGWPPGRHHTNPLYSAWGDGRGVVTIPTLSKCGQEIDWLLHLIVSQE